MDSFLAEHRAHVLCVFSKGVEGAWIFNISQQNPGCYPTHPPLPRFSVVSRAAGSGRAQLHLGDERNQGGVKEIKGQSTASFLVISPSTMSFIEGWHC